MLKAYKIYRCFFIFCTSFLLYSATIQVADWQSARLLYDYTKSFFKPSDKKNDRRSSVYAHQVARVVKLDGICQQEKLYRAKRVKVVSKTISAFAGIDIPEYQTPTVAVLGSGGGYRALLWMLGAFVGLEKIGLLDAITYASGLSGTGWFLANYMQRSLTPTELKDRLLKIMGVKRSIFSPHAADRKMIFDLILHEKKSIYGAGTHSLVDLYGALLINQMFADFTDKRFSLRLSDQIDQFKDGSRIFPIYTSVERTKEGLGWYEYTPYYVKSLDYKAAIPTWAYGRTFIKGKSINFVQELPLFSLLGTFGSAFAISLDRGWQEYLKKKNISSPAQMVFWQKFVDRFVMHSGYVPIKGGIIPNFMYKIPQYGEKSKEKFLHLIDPNAETNINFSFPPLTKNVGGRDVDVLIFLDASRYIQNGRHLKRAEDYARTHDIKFPQIDYTGIDTRSMSVFVDETDPAVPIVIYIPRVVNTEEVCDDCIAQSLLEKVRNLDVEKKIKSGPYHTLNFSYSREDIDRLSSASELIIHKHKDRLKQLFIHAYERKKIYE